MAGNPVDTTPFLHAVIQHLASCTDGATFVAQLGLMTPIKTAWTALGLPKSKKMHMLLDARPDLFTRFMTEKNQPMIKLEPLAFQCVPPNPIPPMDPAFSNKASAKTLTQAIPAGSSPAAVQALGLPAPGVRMTESEARKCFLRNALAVLAKCANGSTNMSQLGSAPEVQQAWKAGGLDKKYNMIQICKERPDLMTVHVDEKALQICTLTEAGIHAVLQEYVPDPDRNICPPPAEPKKNAWLERQLKAGKAVGKGQNNRSSPYGDASSGAAGNFNQDQAILQAWANYAALGYAVPGALGSSTLGFSPA
eukprot:gnl/TRDRNA2_/TRDRNA2_151928_c0_seq1.p1 gnl/TRDRNA2_/TRDRNA2_151928_c0~~gnl/TRDRNA2_/TRDRNA2_151928_c0_seq1.p1  ORF type:complete len:308 (-),score=65.88 gnl/TRDRNA2_/TRDRNA2_151928_c0_seq1:167-1090(-)